MNYCRHPCLHLHAGPYLVPSHGPYLGAHLDHYFSIVSGHCIKPVVLNSCLPMRSASLRGPPRRGARRLAGPGFFQGPSQLAGSGGLRGPPFLPAGAGSGIRKLPGAPAQSTQHAHAHTRAYARAHAHTRARSRTHTHTHTHTRTHTHRHTRARSMRQACAQNRCYARRLTELALASRCRHYGPSQTVQGCTLYTQMHACVSRHKAARGIRPDPGPLRHGLRARPIPFLVRLQSVAWLCLRRVK